MATTKPRRSTRQSVSADHVVSRTKWELLLQDEAGETFRTTVSYAPLSEVEETLRVYRQLFPNGCTAYQPLILPMLVDGSSQYPDADFVKGFSVLKGGDA